MTHWLVRLGGKEVVEMQEVLETVSCVRVPVWEDLSPL